MSTFGGKMDHKVGVSLLLVLLLGLCTAQPEDGSNAENPAGQSDKEGISTVILRMNNATLNRLHEGDVVIPTTRNGYKCLNKQYSCFWAKSPNGLVEVPFIIDEKYGESEKKVILKAMKAFEPKTCIRFVPHKKERAYLSIVPNFGCSSLVGRIGEKQLVSLQIPGCVDHGIIQHELLHALGFYHEHNRSDRDKYVKINWDNIMKPFWKDFQLMDTDNLGTKYDYSSVMQYGKTAFGTNGLQSIVPIPDPNVPIGQRVGMSDTDILRINKLYKCSNSKG
ncbi:low choriolytic enzyme isoform X2 [Austrofundulus limnaeus]|uniref:Metalloendopeptidase n=1 Tax=Austrofundulus limnaeus TaxID=52670 RepID=A0A2I4BCB7_AUSLI|nr:PREDICTED: low choriolytic enzyme-like isoform X2 [Austrofundulus limnaeus]